MSKDSASIENYYSDLPKDRMKRINKIRTVFLSSEIGISETFKYKMPTFEKDGNWVALANNKNYISVYFCSEELIKNIKKKYPDINTGKGCVRLRDNDKILLNELKKSFLTAMRLKK